MRNICFVDGDDIMKRWVNLNLIEFIELLLLAGILITPITLTQANANDMDFSYTILPSGVSVGLRTTQDVRTILTVLDDDLTNTLSHPLLRNRLPEGFGVLVDGLWKNSSGFFSDTLRTSEGAQAILFSPTALLDRDRSRALIVHELTHLAHHRLRPQEESWIREGVALLAEWIVTRKYNPALSEAFLNPETSLIASLDPTHQDYADTAKRGAQYGHLLQYFVYIYRLCGGDALMEKLVTSPSRKTGTAFMDEVLRSSTSRSESCASFERSFRAFSIARMKQDTLNPESYILITRLQSTIRDERRDLPPYSSSVVRLKEGQTCQSGETPWGKSRCIRVRAE